VEERYCCALISRTSNLNPQEDHQLTHLTDSIKKVLDGCSGDERKEIRLHLATLAPHPLEDELEVDAETILDAIKRSDPIGKRGIRGLVAKAVFERDALPAAAKNGWTPVTGKPTDTFYDFHLERGDRKVRIQVKLQRIEKFQPMRFNPKCYSEELYDVEIQKTRGGKKRPKDQMKGANALVEAVMENEDTRPYKFTDFDILAVNMHPLTKRWNNFRFTVASWLIARSKNSSLIEIHQPVAKEPNDVWTDDLNTCLDWFLSGDQRKVLTDLKHGAWRPKKVGNPKRKTKAKRKLGANRGAKP
jgi:hypothetical protein